MVFNEKIFRLITIALIIIFAGGLFFTVRFFKKSIVNANSPSAAVVQTNNITFDQTTYKKIIDRLGSQ